MALPNTKLALADAKKLLRDAGLRSTAARIAVLQRLSDAGVPLTHGEVTEALSQIGFDQSTIYRCLHELSEAGILSRLDLGDQVRRFEFRQNSAADTPAHPHFMCVACGKILCLEDFKVQIKPTSPRTSRWVGTITEVLVKGRCAECE